MNALDIQFTNQQTKAAYWTYALAHSEQFRTYVPRWEFDNAYDLAAYLACWYRFDVIERWEPTDEPPYVDSTVVDLVVDPVDWYQIIDLLYSDFIVAAE